ncbi:hypothetical protein [Limosilactobacillus ingluviei]|uniref:hypothetical protein n=1 Tax=Limosilactobacillus ingluviei TaxID=148604 RepID=UPI000593D766|nr:hypothetical protein [Limosilactobacillus ingluviei]
MVADISYLFVINRIKKTIGNDNKKLSNLASTFNKYPFVNYKEFDDTKLSTLFYDKKKISSQPLRRSLSYLFLEKENDFTTLLIPNNQSIKKFMLDALIDLSALTDFDSEYSFENLKHKRFYSIISKLYNKRVNKFSLDQLILRKCYSNFIIDNNFCAVETLSKEEVIEYNIKKFKLNNFDPYDLKLEDNQKLFYFRSKINMEREGYSTFWTAIKIELFELLDGQVFYH